MNETDKHLNDLVKEGKDYEKAANDRVNYTFTTSTYEEAVKRHNAAIRRAELFLLRQGKKGTRIRVAWPFLPRVKGELIGVEPNDMATILVDPRFREIGDDDGLRDIGIDQLELDYAQT